MHHPHHEKHVPSFCKRYAKLGGDIHTALVQYRTEVKDSLFPTEDFSPYKMAPGETDKFVELMRLDKRVRQQPSETVAKSLGDSDENAVTKVY